MMISRPTLRLLGTSLLLIPAFVILCLSPPVTAAERISRSFNKCDFHRASCTATLPHATVTLDIRPKPVKAMKTLTFELQVSGRLPDSSPYIDLGMPGMKMGPNRVLLKALGEGRYQGQGIIVRCPSGKRLWRAEVTLPGVGIAGFVFDVLY